LDAKEWLKTNHDQLIAPPSEAEEEDEDTE
jgi:hypothetical protein